jgi:hypothetical protein
LVSLPFSFIRHMVIMMFCILAFFLFRLAIVLFVPLRFTSSDYPFGIFKLFFKVNLNSVNKVTDLFFICISYTYDIMVKRNRSVSKSSTNQIISGIVPNQ